MKRRSFDACQLLGSINDVRQDDPVFVLRRATAYCNSISRRRSSVPLDEFAMHQLHMNSESTSSSNSDAHSPIDESKLKQSRQEIIVAQRAATRATQRVTGLSSDDRNIHSGAATPLSVTPIATPRSQQRWPVIPKDDFGHAPMIAIIEYKGLKLKPQ